MAKFFIDRPIFAWVIAIVLMLAGVASIFKMPIAQYPTIAPPTIQIQANYPGASAKTVEDTVTQVIEQQMSGLDNFLYMSSTSDDSGNATITLTFSPGTNPDVAQVQVQNKLSLATPNLPQVVQQLGMQVTKSSSNWLMWFAFNSDDGSMSKEDLTNYVASHVLDPLSRVNGVGQTLLLGSQFSMRIWLDPVKLTNYSLTPTDVSAAITQQNVQIAGGQIGGTPAKPGTMLQATITESTLLRTPEQFGNILLKVNGRFTGAPEGRRPRGAGFGELHVRHEVHGAADGRPRHPARDRRERAGDRDRAAGQGPGAVEVLPARSRRPLSVRHDAVRAPVDRGSGQDAARRYRARVPRDVPVPAEPAGDDHPDDRGAGRAARHVRDHGRRRLSINTLSMFGLVLAIGLLVDDAIVVVENVERVMAEEGLSPKEATRKAMGQITGALVGVALVLSAVFVPVAFSGGSVGAIYRQFSLTIVSAMVLSVLVALILTPALCATILKPIEKGHHEEKKGFFGWFNRTFDRSRDRYTSGVNHVIRRSGRWLVIYLRVHRGRRDVRAPAEIVPAG